MRLYKLINEQPQAGDIIKHKSGTPEFTVQPGGVIHVVRRSIIIHPDDWEALGFEFFRREPVVVVETTSRLIDSATFRIEIFNDSKFHSGQAWVTNSEPLVCRGEKLRATPYTAPSGKMAAVLNERDIVIAKFSEGTLDENLAAANKFIKKFEQG